MALWKGRDDKDKLEKDNKGMAMNGSSGIADAVNHLAEGTKFKGEIEAQSNIRIDGDFEGKIKCAGKLVVGPSGKISGNIECQSADISGEAKVTIQVYELIELRSSARFTGEIVAKQISVEPGCQISNTKINFLSPSEKGKALFEGAAANKELD